MAHNEQIVKEWISFAQMDYRAAKHLYLHMIPRPNEIICYHCQQSVEKLLKGLLLSYGDSIQKTHDLGYLAERLSDFIEIPDVYLDMCDALTPYGIKVRYPQHIEISEAHVKQALKYAAEIFSWQGYEVRDEE